MPSPGNKIHLTGFVFSNKPNKGYTIFLHYLLQNTSSVGPVTILYKSNKYTGKKLRKVQRFYQNSFLLSTPPQKKSALFSQEN